MGAADIVRCSHLIIYVEKANFSRHGMHRIPMHTIKFIVPISIMGRKEIIILYELLLSSIAKKNKSLLY